MANVENQDAVWDFFIQVNYMCFTNSTCFLNLNEILKIKTDGRNSNSEKFSTITSKILEILKSKTRISKAIIWWCIISIMVNNHMNENILVLRQGVDIKWTYLFLYPSNQVGGLCVVAFYHWNALKCDSIWWNSRQCNFCI